MKRFIISTFLIILSGFAFAQGSSDLRIGGELLTDQRFFLKDGNDWAWNETRLDLRLDKRTDKVKFYGNVWLRNLGGPTTTDIPGLFSKDKINPWNLDIREAYAEVFGFLSDNLDLKIGRQRIAWGTGDQFNPTDNLNPYDVEDILDFGRHQGSEAITSPGISATMLPCRACICRFFARQPCHWASFLIYSIQFRNFPEV